MNSSTPDHELLRFASYVESATFESLPEEVVAACTMRIVDAVGCGLAGFASEPAVAGRRIAARAVVDSGARIMGTRTRVLPEYAAFANGLMVRYLDGNDTYLNGGGHPSDVIGPVLAAGDWLKASGAEVMTAVVIAYEAYHWIFRATSVREKGWDHSFYTAVGVAAAVARLLKLPNEQTRNALSIAMTANHALLATRQGSLSVWKGCAAPYAARDGFLCALLAAEGIAGPARPLSGPAGVAERFGPLQFPALGGPSHAYAITQSHLKCHLAYYHAQTAIDLALRLQKALDGEGIAAVDVYVYEVKGLGATLDPEKWRPQSREMADHSIPYIVAAVLVEGEFNDALFDEERRTDPRILDVADRLSMHIDPSFASAPPETSPCRIEVRTAAGRVLTESAQYPKGHRLHALTATEVQTKYLELAQRAMPAEQAQRALDAMLALPQQANLDALMEALVLAPQERPSREAGQ